MRDEKEERKKQARSNKQTRQSNTAHPRQSHVHVLLSHVHMGVVTHTHVRTFHTCILQHRRVHQVLSCYFPLASITRKLHIFEDHVVLFIRQCRVGLGVMGEQGVESIHNRFNVLERTYSNMPNKVNRLKCMVADHFRQVFPANIVKQPPAAKRAKREEWTHFTFILVHVLFIIDLYII